MTQRMKPLLFWLFFLSGFCGLLYQVVWVRLAFASFGVITPVLSVVISVFMLGLFVGSWAAGKFVRPLTAKWKRSAIGFYAIAEALIGVGAFAVPSLLTAGETALLGMGQTDSSGYLFWSAAIIAGAVFPWCVFMGMTFPLMMAYVEENEGAEKTSFSFLYLANVIGAMVGTLLTALVLVEVLGFRGTLTVAAVLNFTIAAFAGWLAMRSRYNGQQVARAEAAGEQATAALGARYRNLVLTTLFASGFTSMAMEVVWTRAFTRVLKTQVYSFALLLFTYLLATWIGSRRYRRDLDRGKVRTIGELATGLAVGSLLPLLMNDPRLQLNGYGALVSIFPICMLLGYLTPMLIDQYSAGRPETAGTSYALNVFGCILGPLVASYWLLPVLGLKLSLLLLAAPYLVLFVGCARQSNFASRGKRVGYVVAALLLSVTFARTYEDQLTAEHWKVRRDHTATVVSVGTERWNKQLLVNGIGITYLTPVTKVMAHFPLAVLNHAPKSALVICFGMGTTFRSLLSWGIDTTAAELVPSVKDAFPFYFADAEELVQRPNAHIVVDDGRRFLRRTSQSFDLITLDPPPPVEAAGSSLLYSEEFYIAVKDRLTEGGILQQWLPMTEPRIEAAVLKALTASFTYVRVFASYESGGHHFLASQSPIEIPDAATLAAKLPSKAAQDFLEWGPFSTTTEFFQETLKREVNANQMARGQTVSIRDDRPFNEYYLLRRTFGKKQTSR